MENSLYKLKSHFSGQNLAKFQQKRKHWSTPKKVIFSLFFFICFPFLLISFLTYLLALKPFVCFCLCISFYLVLLYCWCSSSSLFVFFVCFLSLVFFSTFVFWCHFFEMEKERGKTKMVRREEVWRGGEAVKKWREEERKNK